MNNNKNFQSYNQITKLFDVTVMTKQLTIRKILLDFIKEQRAFNKKVDTRFKTIDAQFKAHGWTK